MTDRVQSIERAIDILSVLASGPKPLKDVALGSGLSKGTAFRLLASLGYRNLVIKDPIENVYSLGPGFLRLVDGANQGLSTIASIARPSLEKLRDLTRETVALHVRVGTERICIGELVSPEPIRYSASVGTPTPAHVGAAGRVLLAFMNDAALERLLPLLDMRPITEHTVTSVETLRRDLLMVRRQGYATSVSERTPGASAITVPILGSDGVVVALSVLGPTARLPRRRLLKLLDHARAAASEISPALNPDGMQAQEKVG